jgi:hypothetical protein
MTDFSSMPSLRLMDAEEGLHSMFKSARISGADTTDLLLLHEDITEAMRGQGLFYTPLAKATDHDFAPVRNVCRNCRKHGDDHGDSDHDLVPVRDICRNCGQGSSMHKNVMNKTMGDLLMVKSIEFINANVMLKALPQYDAQSRQKMAETGIALPDGSFPIPDEAHLHAAIRLVGQAADPQSAMNHIIERAKAMGMEEALPPAWQTMDPAAPGAPQIGDGAHTIAGANAGQPTRATMAGGKPSPGAGGPGGTPNTGAGSSSTGSKPDGWQDPTTPKPGLMKRLAKAVGAAMGGDFDAATFMKELEINLDPEFEYAIVKSIAEERYTLGPVYMPDTLDAHGEWATAEDLQKSAINYVKSTGADRTIYLQHSDQPAGEWVGIMAWPHEVTAHMTKSVDGVRKSTDTVFPAGTVYMGVEWAPWAWEEVKKGKITGFSMGGFARRLEGIPA